MLSWFGLAEHVIEPQDLQNKVPAGKYETPALRSRNSSLAITTGSTEKARAEKKGAKTDSPNAVSSEAQTAQILQNSKDNNIFTPFFT
jgi:hypothetical protein